VWGKGVRVGTRTKIGVTLAVVIVAVGAVAVSWWVNRDTIDEVSIDQALDNAAAEQPSDTPLTLDGTWQVSSTAESFAGVRIDEELRGVGPFTAVLRTSDVTGSATISDGMLESLTITVDLTTLTSDDARRDRSVATAIDFVNFPSAIFTLDTPIDVSSLTDTQLTFDAPGTLTINGVQQAVVATVTVDTTTGALIAVAQMPVTFADFGVRLPSAPIVLSINDSGVIETQLRFIPG
jgi:polyisoprenoid-binding protein YceI